MFDGGDIFTSEFSEDLYEALEVTFLGLHMRINALVNTFEFRLDGLGDDVLEFAAHGPGEESPRPHDDETDHGDDGRVEVLRGHGAGLSFCEVVTRQ